MKDRRAAKRISTNLPARWGTSVRSHGGRVIDLSSQGCFVQTGDHPPANKVPRVERAAECKAIQIEIEFSVDQCLILNGEVVYEVEHTGFAVRFANLSFDQDQVIRRFIEIQELVITGPLPFPRV
jgi:hypothetical protein